MIQSILAKSLAELAKDTPDLSYIKGMLEVLAAMQESPNLAPPVLTRPATPVVGGGGSTEKQDPALILDAAAKASLATIKALSEKSTD